MRARGNRIPLSIALFLGLVLLAPSTASAGTATNQRPFLFGFDGSDSSMGHFNALLAVAVNEANGDLYVINAAGSGKGPKGYGSGPGEVDDERVFCKFNAKGEAQPFTAGSSAGKSCLDGKDTSEGAFGVEGFFESESFFADVAIDNSGGAGGPGEGEQGRIYVSEEDGPIHAFKPSGEWLWTLPRTVARPCGIAVDRKGRLWVGNGYGEGPVRNKVLVFDPEASLIDELSMTHGSELPCWLAIDKSGEGLYVSLISNQNFPRELDRYRDGTYDSTVPNSAGSNNMDVTIDQSRTDGHLFAGNGGKFREYEPCAAVGCELPEAPGSPFGGDLITNARGIVYNPALDHIYVTDRATDTVKAFGPITSGAVPDVSCQKTEPVGRHEATANCTINPVGLENEYYLEWKPCQSAECLSPSDANWGTAQSSTAQSIEPPDSISHSISLEIAEYAGKPLNSNAWFEVRLVGTNAEAGLNKLSAYSARDVFQTLPPSPPDVFECQMSAITASSAHAKCTVDPEEEEADWKIGYAPLSGASPVTCALLPDSAFKTAAQGTIPPEEPGLVLIEASLEGVLPAQSYCLRGSAENSGGKDAEDIAFATDLIGPSDVSLAFAAPRTDTGARINARVNPNGEAANAGGIDYFFELSKDGSSWQKLPERHVDLDGREALIISEELTGLDPAATYHYRLGMLKTDGGEASGLGEGGEERIFTMRSSTEVLPEPGIEMVNNPDTGNQNVFMRLERHVPYLSSDGNEAFWGVSGGAPGSVTGIFATFLAHRTETKWESQNAIPPAEEQVGGGSYEYKFDAATPDFTRFVARVGEASKQVSAATLVRLEPQAGQGAHQDVLGTFKWSGVDFELGGVEMSEDGSHVLVVDPETHQLEDIGTGSRKVVSIMPSGTTSSECGLSTAAGRPGFIAYSTKEDPQWRLGYRMMSADGSLVYFRAPPNGECNGPLALFVRDRNAKAKGGTALISPGSGGEDVEFIRTSRDGSTAFFVTGSALDPADTNSDRDIYRWDQNAKKAGCLTCVVTDADIGDDAAPAFRSVLVSDDLSHVYFLSRRQLVPGRGIPGTANLYVLRGGSLGFVATIEAGGYLSKGNTALSADGKALLFGSESKLPRLTSDRIDCGKSFCLQLYRYEDEEESIECLTCVQGGLTERGLPTGTDAQSGGFDLSADGSTAAFVAEGALVEEDVNRSPDVYQWRASRRDLLSDGITELQGGNVASSPSVWGISDSGSDILFAVAEPGLTGFEEDRLRNLYDARIGGGFVPPTPPVHCVEDSCQGPLVPAPEAGHSASSTFAGAGNPRPPVNCVQGKRRMKRGRKTHCVKRHRKGQHGSPRGAGRGK